jgi:hypothetical protein
MGRNLGWLLDAALLFYRKLIRTLSGHPKEDSAHSGVYLGAR